MKEKSGITPPALQNKPELGYEWEYPMSVWKNLTGSRAIHQGGIGEIVFSEVASWCVTHGIYGEDLDELWREVHHIDTVWTQQTRLKMAEEAKDAEKKKGTVPNSAQSTRPEDARP